MSDVELVREFEAVGFDIKANLFHKGRRDKPSYCVIDLRCSPRDSH